MGDKRLKGSEESEEIPTDVMGGKDTFEMRSTINPVGISSFLLQFDSKRD